MHYAATILKTLGLISLLTGGLLLGAMHNDAIHHMPVPVNTITGSLG